MKSNILFLFLVLALLAVSGNVYADHAVTETEYRNQMDLHNIPEVLNVNSWIDCGNFQIRLMAQPVVTASTTNLKASGNQSFLVVRASIKNLSDSPVSWLEPKSFQVKEYYLDILGGTYTLNHYMSAKTAQSFNLPAFFTQIQPESELSTVLVFEVYGNVDGWVMTFSPFTRDEEKPVESVSFTLPKALRQ